MEPTGKNLFGASVDMKIGRQQVVLDGHRLFGHTGWTQGAETKDAIRLTHAAGNHTLNYTYIAGDESVLEVALNYAPEIPRACLAAQNEPNRMVAVAEELACTRVQFGRNATDDALRRARDLELTCNLFWSDELTDAQRYVEMGIDVVLTNAAHKLLALVPVPGR